jgi:diamine N-acetyltransferase
MTTSRIAGPEDAAALADLFRRSFTETFGHLYSAANLAAFLAGQSEQAWREELTDPRFALRLAEAGGEIVAFVKLGPPAFPIEMPAASIELRQLYVLQPWQGAGLAAALMDWALDETRARGAEEIYLSVYVDNVRARRFYERYGFEYAGQYAFMVGTQADEDLIMRLRLG